MIRPLRTVLHGICFASCVAFLVASCKPMQEPPAKPVMAVPAPGAEGYVGADTCKGCHEDQFARFSGTRMGRLFLHAPRNEQERLACENCHGPGKAHVEAGGGKGTKTLVREEGPDAGRAAQHHVPVSATENARASSGRGAPTSPATLRARAATG